jgi:DNA gyrase subunit A
VQLTEARGQLAGSLVVLEGDQVMLISTGGTVIRLASRDIKCSGRSTQGVIVMRLREGERVSTLTGVVEQENGDPLAGAEGGAAAGAAVEEPAEIETDAETEPAA